MMQHVTVISAVYRLLGLAALIVFAAMPAGAVESTNRSADQIAYEQCLKRLGCPKTESTCHLHCRTNPTLGDGPYGSGNTNIQQQGGGARVKAAPVQNLQVAPAQ